MSSFTPAAAAWPALDGARLPLSFADVEPVALGMASQYWSIADDPGGASHLDARLLAGETSVAMALANRVKRTTSRIGRNIRMPSRTRRARDG